MGLRDARESAFQHWRDRYDDPVVLAASRAECYHAVHPFSEEPATFCPADHTIAELVVRERAEVESHLDECDLPQCQMLF